MVNKKEQDISTQELFSNIKYDRKWYEKGGKHSLDNRISDLLEFLPAEPIYDAIDIGCAEGEMISHFSIFFSRLDGIEKSESLFKTAKQKFNDSPKTNVICASIDQYELPRSYDFIYLLGVLHYFEFEDQREHVIEKLMLKTNNTLFIRTSFLENRISRPSEKKLHLSKVKSCSLLTIAKLCDQHGFRWRFIDNRYRGTGNNRLGDLVILERVNN